MFIYNRNPEALEYAQTVAFATLVLAQLIHVFDCRSERSIVGTQWGDEGKGKITDFLSENAEVIARYQGGNNAGHTIKFNGVTYKLHLIPSGIFYKDKTCVIGNGMVVDPKALVTELAYLHERNVSTDNLRISNRAHVILPYHLKLDASRNLK